MCVSSWVVDPLSQQCRTTATVVTWGSEDDGGNSNAVEDHLASVSVTLSGTAALSEQEQETAERRRIGHLQL